MKTLGWPTIAFLSVFSVRGRDGIGFGHATPPQILTGRSAFVTSHRVQPGTFRKITPADLPKPFMTSLSPYGRRSSRGRRNAAAGAARLPCGPLRGQLEYAPRDLSGPQWRHLPGGNASRRVRVFRGISADGKPRETAVFASGFHEPSGSLSILRGRTRSGCTWRTRTRWSGTPITPAI